MQASARRSRNRRHPGASMSFATILDQTRAECSRLAWGRARAASAFRQEVIRCRRLAAARALSRLKTDGVRRALELAPELISIALDDDLQIGLLSVKYADGSRLHLPAATDTATWGPRTGSPYVRET